jgi:hypothetical protein
MKQTSLTIFILNLVLIGSIHATENQNSAQESEIIHTSHTEDVIKELAIDPILTQAIKFSNAVGDWFEDLFDKKQHMSFNAHVNKLEKIITGMHATLVAPLANEKNGNDITLATYNLTSTLYARAEKTYSILNKNRNNTSFFKLINALKKIDKHFMSEQEKTKLKKAFKELHAQLNFDQALCKKITKLETVVAENSTRTKQKGMWALGWGLRHRLQCS